MQGSNNIIANLVAADGRKIAQSDLDLAGELEQWLAGSHANVLTALEQGTKRRFTRKDVDAIPEELFKASFPVSSAVRMTGMLANAIDQANRIHKRNLPLPPIGQLRRRQKSPWSNSFFENQRRAENLVLAFQEMLKSGVPGTSCGQFNHLAVVIPSAILFGGVLHRDSLAALVRTCADPANRWSYFGQRLQLELHISWRREVDAERRFWFPDALTALLLMRFRNQIACEAQSGLAMLGRGDNPSDSTISNWLWVEVLKPFRQASRGRGTTERSLHQLLEIVTSRYRMAVPEVLVAYMTREILSSSLTKRTLARVHGISLEDEVDVPPPDRSPNDSSNIDREPGVITHDLNVIEADWIHEIRSAFRAGTIAGIRNNLRDIAGEHRPAPAKRFAEFGDWLLRERSAFNRHLHLSTVKTYVRILAAKLGGTLDNEDPAKLPSGALLNKYLYALEEVSDGGRRKSLRLRLARAINEFHAFLCKNFGVEPIQAAELGLGSAASASVDAGLITEAEYNQVVSYISGYTGAPDDATIVPGALLLLQFGFRTGVRREELHHLRICDLILSGQGVTKVSEVTIRPWGTHELKSANAIRRIPTELLFTPDENLRLEQWVANKTQVKGINKEASFFEPLESDGGSSSFHRMISLVVSAMRKVTGDQTLRFHHLCHSAASALFARLILHGAGISPRKWPTQLMPLPKDALMTARLHEALTDSSGPTRKALFAIARLTGHSDPDTDCASYIHAFDGVQAALLENSSIAPARELLVAATSLKHTQAYKLIERSGPWVLANRYAPRVWPHSTHSAQSADTPEIPPRLWLENLYDFLVLSETRSAAPIEDLAPDHGFDPVQADRMIDRARQLRDMCTPNHTLKFEMEMQHHPEEKRLYTPRHPHILSNRKLARELASGIEHALQVSHHDSEKAIDIWIDRVKLKEMRIIFKRFDQAIHATILRKFFDRAGIDFRWIGFDRALDSRSIARWRRELRIGNVPVEIQEPPPHSGKLAYRWIAIEPSFPVIAQTGGRNGIDGTEAFRFVMVMAAIYASGEEALQP